MPTSPYKLPRAPRDRTLIEIAADHLWLRFECFACGKRSAVDPQRTRGFPDGTLRYLQENMTCARCGSNVCELVEVWWCKEMGEIPKPLPWPRPLEFKEAAE